MWTGIGVNGIDWNGILYLDDLKVRGNTTTNDLAALGTTQLGATNISSAQITSLTSEDSLIVSGTLYIDGLTQGQLMFTGTSDAVTGSSSLFWDNTNSRLGVGTSSPAARTHIYFQRLTPLTANTTANYIETKYTPNATASTYNLNAMQIQCHNNSAYTVEDVRGLWCIAGKEQSGNVNTAMAGAFYINNENSSNAITTAYNIYIYQPYCAPSGSIGTVYGIYMASQTRTGVTTAYGFYGAGASDLNYFAGYLGVGTAASSSYRVNVTGYVNVAGTSGNTYRWNAATTAPSTAAAGAVTNRYGGATNFLGDPVAWALVRVNATDYKIPLYT